MLLLLWVVAVAVAYAETYNYDCIFAVRCHPLQSSSLAAASELKQHSYIRFRGSADFQPMEMIMTDQASVSRQICELVFTSTLQPPNLSTWPASKLAAMYSYCRCSVPYIEGRSLLPFGEQVAHAQYRQTILAWHAQKIADANTGYRPCQGFYCAQPLGLPDNAVNWRDVTRFRWVESLATGGEPPADNQCSVNFPTFVAMTANN